MPHFKKIIRRSLFQILLLLPGAMLAQNIVVTVNTTDDNDDGQCNSRHCSYREALNYVNGFQSPVYIYFDIAGAGSERRIELTSSLPTVTTFSSLTIDGTSQTNAQVVIDGNGDVDYGLQLFDADNTVVDGLTFDNLRLAGVYVQSGSSDCVIGTEKGGNTFTDSRYGVVIEGQRALIRNNVFDNNDINGVYVTGAGSAVVGEQGNQAASNTFLNHRFAGVEVGEKSTYVNIFGNSFYCNEAEGITNFNNSNNGIEKPIITDVSTSSISGTAKGLSLVQVYIYDPNQKVCNEVNSCQGNIYLGQATADRFGNWKLNQGSFSMPLVSSYLITATQTSYQIDADGLAFYRYTSEFADCANLCDTYTITLTSPGPPCPGDSFIITPEISSSGNNPEPLTYTWTGPNGFTASEAEIKATELGTYTLVATNSCNNIKESIEITAQETPPTNITASYNGPICEGDTLQLFATTARVFYEWTGKFGFSSSEQNPIVNLGASSLRSGTYYLTTKTPINGCPGPSDSVEVLVKAPPLLLDTSLNACTPAAQENIATFDLTSVEEYIKNRDPSITLFWFEDEALQSRITFPEGYQSGTKSVFVVGFDTLGCQSEVVKIPLTVFPQFDIDIQVTSEVTCENPNGGSLLARISGGTEPYVFDWSESNLLGDNPMDLSAGKYSLTVTDAFGCTNTATTTIEAASEIVINCNVINDVSQVGGNDGQAEINILSGMAPYILTIPALGDTVIRRADEGISLLTNLAPGNYTVLVEDASGCQESCTFEIADVDCSGFSVEVTVRPTSCPETATGLINADITGGQAPFNYDWSEDSFDGLSFIQQVGIGDYSLTATDAAGCIASAVATIVASNPEPAISIGNFGELCPANCLEVPHTFTGTAPFLFNYQIEANGQVVDQQLQSSTSETNITICGEDFPQGTTTINLNFLELSDANCNTTLDQNTIVRIQEAALGSLDTILCQGESILINGTLYDENNSFGQELLAGAAQNGCDSILDINIFFPSLPEATRIQTQCDLTNNSFVISFDLLGLSPFTVTGVNGQVFGDQFISAALPANGTYDFTITDGFGCSQSFAVEAPDCSRDGNCTVQAGTIAAFAENICQFDSLMLNTLGDEQLDSTQLQVFVIHNGSESELGDILLSDPDGKFLFESPLNLGLQYFVATLAGKNNGFGKLDLNDPCLDVSLGGAIQFDAAPRRPLYIQGQDTLCVGETLNLSTEKYTQEGLVYNWITPLGDTIQTDSNSVEIPNIQQEDAGTYAIFVQIGNCLSPVFMPHQLVVIDFPILYAGDDQESCGLNQAMLQADPISFGVGTWSTPGSAIIIDENDPLTTVRELEAGMNPFIWTVAANNCISSDTVFISYFPAPILVDDELTLKPGLSRITFDAFANDRVDGLILDENTVQIVSQPEVGMVQYLSDDLVFEYTAELSTAEAIAFEYAVCAPECPEACDTAIVIINLPDVLLDVPEGIIQGRANDGLKIGNLEAFPENEVIIANRWGGVVYKKQNYSNADPWKGTHNGADLPQGTYYLYLRVEERKSVVTKAIHLIAR